MRADGLLELQAKPRPYGPTLVPTEASAGLREHFATSLNPYEHKLDFVARKLGAKGVAELEQLATALYVMRTQPALGTTAERARRIHELKPHVSLNEATFAVAAVDQIAQESCTEQAS
jgi:hypothetical protein